MTLQPKCARRAPLFVCSPNAAMIAATEGSHTRRLMNLIGFVCNVGEDHSSLDDRMDQDVNELPLGTANATTTVPGTIY